MKIGIIGYGSIGKVHAKNLKDMGHKIIIYDPGIHYDDDIEGIVKQSDALVIASPSDWHGKHMKLCSSKPLFVEKPIATKMSYDMAKTVVDSGQLVMVGNNMRYHPVLHEVEKIIGEIGKPYIADFSLLQKNDKYTDPVTLNWGAHEVDMAMYLFGDCFVSGVSTIATQDKADFLLCYKEPITPTSHIKLDYITEPWVRQLHVVSQHGYLCADFEKWIVDISGVDNAEIISVPGTHNYTYMEEMKEFIRRVDGKEPDGIGATGKDGMKCLDVLLEVIKRGQQNAV